ncbi:MAG: response regulator [Acidobacteria bacterium]|nr:MAG: response regulator [Acidobacteriota bacterium]
MAKPNHQLREPARILIVDDEPSVCRSIEKVLHRAGYQTVTTLSASAALDALQANQDFSLIITDLMMPQVNGIELLKIARTNWPSVPVLVITGYASIASAVEAMQLGAANYLAKPFTPEELEDAVRRALRPEPSASDPTADAGKETTGQPDVTYDLTEAEMVVGHWAEPTLPADAPSILVIDNEVVVVNTVRKIFSRKGYHVEGAFTGGEALQRIQERSYNLVLLDMRLPDFDGLQLLSRIRDIKPDAAVMVITGYASLDTAVEAIRRGAAYYMAKPFTPEELLQATARVLGREKSD